MVRFASVDAVEYENILKGMNSVNCMIKHLLDSAMADIDLFSLAKIISNSASGLVGYYFARLNKSRYPPSPCPISVYYLTEVRFAERTRVKITLGL